MRTVTIDFTAETIVGSRDLGRQGEHNATQLVVTVPTEFTTHGASIYRLAFKAGDKDPFLTEGFSTNPFTVSIPSAWTQQTRASIQVVGFNTDGDMVIKSQKLSSFEFAPSLKGEFVDVEDNDDIYSEITKNTLARHTHSNKALLDTYAQTEANLADAVNTKHSHSNKSLLDTYAQTESDIADAVTKKHNHENKALLDTYAQTEADLSDAVSKKHSHDNKSTVLDKLGVSGDILTYDGTPVDKINIVDYKSGSTYYSKYTPRELMAMSNRSLIFLGNPIIAMGNSVYNLDCWYTEGETPYLKKLTVAADKSITYNQEAISLSGAEYTSNKVTSLSASSTDTQYPSAKAVYDELSSQSAEIEALQAKKNVETVESVSAMTDTTKCYILKVSGDVYYYDSSASKWKVTKGIDAGTWAEVQSNVRAGQGSSFEVGTQFTENRGSSTITFDVLDHDKHTPADSDLSRTLCIGCHDVVAYGTIPFDAPELLYYCPDGLVAGTYKLTTYKGTYGGATTEDGTYVFTLTQDIPAGGGLRHSLMGGYSSSGYSKSRICGGKFISYGALPSRTKIEEVATAEWTTETATDLGTFSSRETAYLTETKNSTERNAYGSNRYSQSAVRQWLNSSASSSWWTPQHNFDMPPAGTNLAGFLNGFSDDFVNAICPVKVRCYLNNNDKATTGLTYEDVEDKVWLQSSTEVFNQSGAGVEGTQLAYWADSENSKIKYQVTASGSTARYWWLRSASPSNPSNAYYVNTSGTRISNNVSSGSGLAPACCIG